MSSNNNYYKDLNLIRLLSCISVFLYHLNILKGGYLAVCIFFVLSGYLACISAFKKEKFSLSSYYCNRIKKVYLPLMIVVFVTIGILKLTSSNLWLNLKPETNSVLFGYNNFWQINANTDYFARHIDSPFIHLWYIAILLQFELIFPFIYLIFRKIGNKFGKIFPCAITFIISVGFTIYFYIMSITSQNIMIIYYDTFCRIFSLLLGVSLGFIHSYYGPLVSKKTTPKIAKFILLFYLFILTCSFVFINSSSKLFAISMIIVSFIVCRLIDYSIISSQKSVTLFDKFVIFLSGISYEIYLFQYPIIYFFQSIKMDNIFKIFVIIMITFIMSYILSRSLNIKKGKKFNCIRICLFIIVMSISFYGFCNYLIAEDHTEQMKELEKQLEENKEIFSKKQKEYELKYKEEQENWLLTLNDLENGEKQLDSVVQNLKVVGVGDSIMLGAVKELYEKFPNGYFDAQISRTAWIANGILQNLKNRNILGDPIVLNLGANGDCPESVKINIMSTIEKRKIFWINVTNDESVHVNDNLYLLAQKYDNLHIIDWNFKSKNHPEYFVADGIHLSEIGKKAYVQTIYDSIYEVYLKEYQEKKQEIINNHSEQLKNKITFYGDKILLNIFNQLQTTYANANYIIKDNMDYYMLKESLDESIINNSLTNKIVFLLDRNTTLKKEEYLSLMELCNDKKIYIVSMNDNMSKNLSEIEKENIKIIKFNEVVNNNKKEYLSVDGIHLTQLGNKILIDLLNSELSN